MTCEQTTNKRCECDRFASVSESNACHTATTAGTTSQSWFPVSPGTGADRCSCPTGFTRCAGRCLKRLDQAVTHAEAVSLCASLGAHLAVPRTDAENQCAIDADGASRLWLGWSDVITEGQFVGADGCDVMTAADPRWGGRQPDNVDDQAYVYLRPATEVDPGWHDIWGYMTYYPLCQLASCYLTDCQ